MYFLLNLLLEKWCKLVFAQLMKSLFENKGDDNEQFQVHYEDSGNMASTATFTTINTTTTMVP